MKKETMDLRNKGRGGRVRGRGRGRRECKYFFPRRGLLVAGGVWLGYFSRVGPSKRRVGGADESTGTRGTDPARCLPATFFFWGGTAAAQCSVGKPRRVTGQRGGTASSAA